MHNSEDHIVSTEDLTALIDAGQKAEIDNGISSNLERDDTV